MIKKQLCTLFMLVSFVVVGQRGSLSPYSYFGIGENFNSVTAEQSAMGAIGVAFKSNRYINLVNPAANADLRYATYGLGGSITSLSLDDGINKQTTTLTNLNYVSLGFPIGKKSGLLLGLQPKSSVGYAFLKEVFDADGDVELQSRFTGSGGLNKMFAGFGTYLFKGFSVGLETSFVFGNIKKDIIEQTAGVQFLTKYEESLKIKGLNYKFGVQYQTEVKNNLQLNLGLSFNLESSLPVTFVEDIYSLSLSSSRQEYLSSTSTKTDLKTPFKTIMGAGLGKENKWYVGVNYAFQNAFQDIKHVSLSADNYQYEDANRFSLGGFYLPKINSISSYWNRVTYRGGVRFEKKGLLVAGDATSNNFNSINDFGISFGLGLPIGNQLSNLNVGVEYGQKGTTNSNLVLENYFNFKLSLSLNDIWFQKRKID